MTEAPLRVAAVGAGGGATAHFAAASRIQPIEIVGVLDTQATHPLYVLRWLLGDVESVSAAAGKPTLAMQGEDTAALTVGFRSGAIASLIATFAAAPGSGDQRRGRPRGRADRPRRLPVDHRRPDRRAMKSRR